MVTLQLTTVCKRRYTALYQLDTFAYKWCATLMVLFMALLRTLSEQRYTLVMHTQTLNGCCDAQCDNMTQHFWLVCTMLLWGIHVDGGLLTGTLHWCHSMLSQQACAC
jgi:hypothetical protein